MLYILVIYIALYHMAELAIWSVRKMTHTDWLPNRAISFSYRPARFGGKNFRVDLKTNRPDSVTFYERFAIANDKKVVKSPQQQL